MTLIDLENIQPAVKLHVEI